MCIFTIDIFQGFFSLKQLKSSLFQRLNCKLDIFSDFENGIYQELENKMGE